MAIATLSQRRRVMIIQGENWSMVIHLAKEASVPAYLRHHGFRLCSPWTRSGEHEVAKVERVNQIAAENYNG